LGAVDEIVGLAERVGCVSVVRESARLGVRWADVKDAVLEGLRARGYDVVFKGAWMCLKGAGGLESKVAELLLREGCVHKRAVMSLYGLGEDEWRRLKRRAVKLLASKGLRVYKHGNWTYCVEGARPRMVREMTVPLTVKLDAETHARLEALAREKGVSKAELVREIIAGHLERGAGSSRPGANPAGPAPGNPGAQILS